MIRHPLAVFEKYRREFGPTFTMHLGGAKPAIVSTSPTFVHHALQTNRANYRMSDIRVKRMAEFQGQGLLNSHGDAWLRKRRFLSLGFRRDRLGTLLPLQQEVLEDLMARIDPGAEAGPVDIVELMTTVMFHLVGRSVFGSRMTHAEIEQLSEAIKTIQGFIVRQIVRPYMIPWFRISGQSRRYQRVREEGERIAREYIRTRGAAMDPGGGDVLELLLETPWEESGEGMSREQILIECMQLLVAGNETSPVALSWTLYLLGQHPSFFAQIREEVERVLGGGPITVEGLHRLDLTRRVLDEGMRLYPSFWMIDRVAVDDDEIEGVHIPAGTMVVPYIYGIHRNPDVWDNPEAFDPSRFEPEARKERHPSAHIPFGGGPRKCIGSNMAMVQMLLVLALLVRRYDFELASSEPVEMDPMMVLHPKGSIEMHVRRAA